MRASIVRPLSLCLLLGGSTLLTTPACDQPEVRCQAARGDFAVKYVLIEGQGPCAELTGERIGLQTYNRTVATSDQGTRPDWDAASLSIQPDRLGSLYFRAESQSLPDPDATHKPFGVGAFARPEPDAAGLCAVPDVSQARQNLPLLPEVPADEEHQVPGQPEQPPISLAYRFRNVEVLVTPNAIGTQLRADLEYEENGCVARYRVWGVYPVRSCADADGNPAPARCLESDPGGDAPGESLNPDFAVTCDERTLLCVPAREPPSLK